jgi:MFS family permease
MPLYLKTVFFLDVSQIGLITSIYPLIVACGSLIGGGMADKYGRKTTSFIFIIISIFFTTILFFEINLELVIMLFYILGFLSGAYLAVNFALMMDVTNPKAGATQFSILTSLANGGALFGESSSGSFVSVLGFSRTFLFSAWFLGPPLLVLYFIKQNIQKNKKK